MRGFCDSCDEQAERLFDITRVAEFAEVVRTMNYRHVCQVCYDDLLEESKQPPFKDEDDRRTETRRDLRLKVEISGVDREGKPFRELTTTEDVSLNGACVVTRQDIEIGTILKFGAPDVGFEGTAIVEVIWKQPEDRKAGVKFVERDPVWRQIVTD